MKNKYYLAIITISLIVFGGTAAFAQKADLAVRQAIYFTGTNITSVNPAEQAAQYSVPVYHPGVAHKNPDILKINTGQALSCEKNSTICAYNLGVLVWRDPGQGNTVKDSLDTYGQFTTADGSITGNTVKFKYNGNSKLETTEFILPVKLPLGKQQVTFTLDPQNKIAETDEKNNTVTVFFDVSLGYKIGQETAPIDMHKAGDIPPATKTTPKMPKMTYADLPNLMLQSLDDSKVGIISVTVTNVCKGKSAPTTIELDILKGVDSSSGIMKTVSADVPALAPKGSAVVKLLTGAHGEFDTVLPGHYYELTVDPDDKVKETSEEDNRAWKTKNHYMYSFPQGCAGQK
jgi:hypothetical protein